MATDTRTDVTEIGFLHRLIASTRRLLRAAWTATGLGITVGLGLVLLVTVALADLALAFREGLRLTGLLLVVVPSGWAFINGVLRPLFRRMTSRFVARRIESTLPGIHNRLVSVVDLDSDKQRTFSLAFVRRLIAEAIERVKNFKPFSVVDQSALKRAAMFALIGLVVFATALGVFSDRLPTALARIFQPFADIPPVTGNFFEVTPGPGETKVLRGEPVEFVATVTKGQVDRLRLEIKPVEGDELGKTLWHEMRPELGDGQNVVSGATTWTFRLPAYDSSFEYRVHGGGTWTKLATVTMLERPRIVGLQAAVTYPTYMLMPEPRLNPPDIADVSGPVGSTVEVSVNVEGDASEGEIQLLREEMRTIEVSSLQRFERSWFNEALPKGHAAEGTWEWQPVGDAAKSVPADADPLSAKAGYVGVAAPVPSGKWHSHPVAAGLSYHLFHSAAVPFEVHLGDVLFAEVFVPADQKPEELMLQFHDGSNWEHRVFWGDNKIEAGAIDTPSRRRAGDLPTAGEWVRLEVPARALDLEGRSIRGVNFTQFSGKAIWGRVGTLPPATREVREFAIVGRVPMAEVSNDKSQIADGKDGSTEKAQLKTGKTQNTKHKVQNTRHFAAIREAKRWSGSFPIEQDGWYRVELKNEIDAANLPMREARITAIPDNPPQIMIERPGFDLVLSEPVNVPIVIASFDDYGLGELILSLQRGDGGFIGRPVKTFDSITRADTSLVMLDLSAEGLKNGDVLKYRAEVRDRKGQSAQTQDYQIRIVSNDPNAADKQLASLEKKEDEFEKKLDKLIEEQAKVQEKLEKLAEKYEPLTEKIEAAQDKAETAVADATEKAEAEQAAKDQAEAAKNKDNPAAKDQPKPQPNAAAKDQPQPQQPPKLDPAKLAEIAKLADPMLDADTTKQLNELKQELAQAQQQEQQNAEAAKQLDAELKDLAKEAAKQQLLPPELQREMAAISEAFKEAATEPIKNLAEEIKKSAEAPSKDPKLEQLEARADQVQENLEALKNRVEALREAQKDAKMDAAKALEELNRQMTEQRAELTAQELEQLRAAIEALREKLQKLADEETQMLEFTPEAPESLLPEITNKQRDLERRANKELAKTKELQRREDYKALKQKQKQQKPNADNPNDPVGDEPMTDGELTAEEMAEMQADLNEPDAPSTEAADEFKPAIADEPMPDAAEPDAPADPKSKPKAKAQAQQKSAQQKPSKDKPQAKSKDKPNAKPDAKSKPNTPENRRETLTNREEKKLDQLQKADESLAADQRALDELLGELSELLNNDGEMANADSPMPDDAAAADQPKDPQPAEAQGDMSDAKNSPLSPEQAAELAELLNSEKAQKAMQMAARMQALKSGESTDQQAKKSEKTPQAIQPPPLKSNPKPLGNLDPTNGSQFAMEAALKDLDPATRSLILKMQPRLREELLQGLRDEGPEGYQRFIRDYFKRLTKAGQNKK